MRCEAVIAGVLLDDVRRDVAQPADRKPFLERGNQLIADLSA